MFTHFMKKEDLLSREFLKQFKTRPERSKLILLPKYLTFTIPTKETRAKRLTK